MAPRSESPPPSSSGPARYGADKSLHSAVYQGTQIIINDNCVGGSMNEGFDIVVVSTKEGLGVCTKSYPGSNGTIHKDGGPAILKELTAQRPGELGMAYLTGPGRLPKAKGVIHALGPDWSKAEEKAMGDEPLKSAYTESLILAKDNFKSPRHVVFTPISAEKGYCSGGGPDHSLTAIKQFLDDHKAGTFERIKIAIGGPASNEDLTAGYATAFTKHFGESDEDSSSAETPVKEPSPVKKRAKAAPKKPTKKGNGAAPTGIPAKPGQTQRCTANTKKGPRCKNKAIDGKTTCRLHGKK